MTRMRHRNSGAGMMNSNRGGPPEFLSDHPRRERRMRDLERWMPDALAEYSGR
jgi:Zn-dependent protease with chaperone function